MNWSFTTDLWNPAFAYARQFQFELINAEKRRERIFYFLEEYLNTDSYESDTIGKHDFILFFF